MSADYSTVQYDVVLVATIHFVTLLPILRIFTSTKGFTAIITFTINVVVQP